uniref:Uncharacterized protein n=1 Tax=Meloidogyne enterolobii TaxID=390850 RepID=A0A6V7VDR9_MELEN|nr:unnamed protein product [Meloidogyne enterolobii]
MNFCTKKYISLWFLKGQTEKRKEEKIFIECTPLKTGLDFLAKWEENKHQR